MHKDNRASPKPHRPRTRSARAARRSQRPSANPLHLDARREPVDHAGPRAFDNDQARRIMPAGRTQPEAHGAQSVRARSSPVKKMGVALAGGGPLGGIYEVGALLALADSLEGFDLNALDVYVGVSSGSFVAAALANGISPAQMYRLFIEDDADSALKPELFLKPAFSELGRRLLTVPALLLRAGLQYLRDPFHRGTMESFATLGRAIPTGMFDHCAVDV